MFSIQNKAALRNDFTIRHKNQFYQVPESVRAKDVTLEERFKGKFYIYHKDKQLTYKAIDKQPERPKQPYKPRKPNYVPPKNTL